MDNPFNKDREGIQNRLHNLFEEFKDLDDSEKLLRIYSEVLQVNHSDAIEIEQINEFQETQEVPEDISPYELPVYPTLSIKELSYILYQTKIIDHLIKTNDLRSVSLPLQVLFAKQYNYHVCLTILLFSYYKIL